MIVNTNNVQSQFQALLSSKSDLLQTLKQLEAEHASEQNALHRIRNETSSLTSQFQTTKYQYGTLTKKTSLLQAEVARLESLMKNDERDLKALAEDVTKKELKEWENKMDFVREMEIINEQWRDVLRRTEEEKMKRCHWMTFNGCLEIAKVLQKEISAMSYPNKINDNDIHDDDSQQKYVLLLKDVIHLVHEWSVSVEEHRHVETTLEAWKERVASLRKQVLKDNKEGLRGDELDELERVWGESAQDEHFDIPDPSVQPAQQEKAKQKQQDGHTNMTLFYGTLEDQGVDIIQK